MEGWIKVYRKLWDDEIWGDESEPHNRRSAWIDLLMLANHEDKQIIFDGHPITIKRGQKLTSIRKLSKRWGWSKERTANYLKLLENVGKITRETDSRRTLITIVKYSVYQGEPDSNKDTDKDNNKDSNKDTDSPQTRMIKNDKEKKNKCKISTFGNFNQRDTEEDDIYSILSKGKKGGSQ